MLSILTDQIFDAKRKKKRILYNIFYYDKMYDTLLYKIFDYNIHGYCYSCICSDNATGTYN